MIGQLGQLVDRMLRDATFGRRLGEIAHHDPQREARTYFSLRIEPPGIYARITDPEAIVAIRGVEIVGPFQFAQAPVTLERLVAMGAAFEAGHFELAGRTGVLVASTDQDSSLLTRVSFL